jgi:hypothetical protein
MLVFLLSMLKYDSCSYLRVLKSSSILETKKYCSGQTIVFSIKNGAIYISGPKHTLNKSLKEKEQINVREV